VEFGHLVPGPAGIQFADIAQELGGKSNFNGLTPEQRKNFRIDIYLMSSSVDKLIKGKTVTDPAEVSALHKYSGLLQKETKYIPTWVKFAVALALGLGTMIGRKRIVVTVGEKIGKEHLTYAQGASAEIVAMAAIGMADMWGLPVSTTHVLSSGVAGTMFAQSFGTADEYVAQSVTGLGADPASVRVARRRDFLVLVLRAAACIGSALKPKALSRRSPEVQTRTGSRPLRIRHTGGRPAHK
jgi:phosphate/sulfate permease